MSPDDVGGVPAVMPSNDWWKQTAQSVIGAVSDYQVAKLRAVPAQGGALSSNMSNIPPGQFGNNAQANATPGAAAQAGALGLTARGVVLLVVVAMVGVLLFASSRAR